MPELGDFSCGMLAGSSTCRRHSSVSKPEAVSSTDTQKETTFSGVSRERTRSSSGTGDEEVVASLSLQITKDKKKQQPDKALGNLLCFVVTPDGVGSCTR